MDTLSSWRIKNYFVVFRISKEGVCLGAQVSPSQVAPVALGCLGGLLRVRVVSGGRVEFRRVEVRVVGWVEPLVLHDVLFTRDLNLCDLLLGWLDVMDI